MIRYPYLWDCRKFPVLFPVSIRIRKNSRISANIYRRFLIRAPLIDTHGTDKDIRYSYRRHVINVEVFVVVEYVYLLKMYNT